MNRISYTGASGVDMIQEFADGTQRPIAAVSYSNIREQYPIYTIGQKLPTSYTEKKVGGTILFYEEQDTEVAFDLLLVATENDQTKVMKIRNVELVYQNKDINFLYTFISKSIEPWKEKTND